MSDAIVQELLVLSRTYNLVPVYREILADLETPISVFLKLCHDEPGAFLLESVEGGEQMARYSFLGCRPLAVLESRGETSRLFPGPRSAALGGDGGPAAELTGNPLDQLRAFMARFRPSPPVAAATARPGVPPSLPRFFGGAVGYMSYDLVRHIEHLPGGPVDDLDLPDAAFMVTELVGVFDHLKHKLYLVALAQPEGDAEAAYRRATALLDAALARLRGPVPHLDALDPDPRDELHLTSNTTAVDFMAAVRRAQEYIAAGDIFQVVLSQRLSARIRAHPLQIYRVLRTVNPSPYMYYLRFGDLKIIGSSPEMLVRVEDGVVDTRPIAGTMPRGRDEAEDRQNEAQLKADEKERAEHIMLVDLGRNDIGRVCRYGTVHVRDLMRVERYSHVMHLVSDVRGELAPDRDALAALAGCFPAGTLSGAPKVRAMAIIDELEPTRRGPYGGAVGYLSFSGNLDTCITIRTLVVKGDQAYIQAGAGIVADSDPAREYQETLHKARGMVRTLEMAEEGWL